MEFQNNEYTQDINEDGGVINFFTQSIQVICHLIKKLY